MSFDAVKGADAHRVLGIRRTDAPDTPGVPLVNRLLYGVLAREGVRKEEALGLTWSDLDLKRGAVRLDRNKTDEPRAWVLDPGVAAALRWWRDTHQTDAPGDAPVFVGVLESNRLAETFREHLERAGVDRPDLFEHNDVRRRVNVHALRATFVTLSLANGKGEGWLQDRTGHPRPAWSTDTGASRARSPSSASAP